MNQTTSNLIMIRPKHFNFNKETAENNHFQIEEKQIPEIEIKNRAIREFDNFSNLLLSKGINVQIFDDRDNIITTDSVFPNNWISFHENGDVYLYPMYSRNRRKERRLDIIQELNRMGYYISNTIDLSGHEKENKFLEGTGSMVLDRENNICYAAISERTNTDLLFEFCSKANFEPISFKSYQSVDNERKEIYHTNVIMCIADKFAIICLDSIDNEEEKRKVTYKLKSTNKQIIEISEEQCSSFAGNMLQVQNTKNDKFLIMSKTAYNSLSSKQIKKIQLFNEIIFSDLNTIEKLGGGSARCMIAENFLRKK
tara:strand:+ start:3703 stop:4638 length:936 start_codon:yes stop_codon:yes gene_type:complete